MESQRVTDNTNLNMSQGEGVHKTVRVNTSLLFHFPFFVGGNRNRKENAKKDGYIKIEKKGKHKLTYENHLGELLTTKDARVLFALYDIWEKQNYKEWFSFTEYDVGKFYNLYLGGSQYYSLRSSLNRLRSTYIKLHDVRDVQRINKRFHREFSLFQMKSSTIKPNKNGDIFYKVYRFKFPDYIRQFMLSRDATEVNLSVLTSLGTSMAQALYLIIEAQKNEHMGNHPVSFRSKWLNFTLRNLYADLFLESYPFRNKQHMEKGLLELQRKEVIEDFQFVKRGRTFTNLWVKC